jgi:hypothetical protein
MTTKQKCEKLAKALDTVASKLREDIGAEVWESEEPAVQALIAQVQVFLKKAILIENKKSSGTSKTLDDWPEFLQ